MKIGTVVRGWLAILGLTVAMLAGAAVPPVPYGDNPAAGAFYAVRGMRMYCEVYGTGRPLLMIHGNGGSIAAFSENLPYFSQHYRAIVADSRAQGKSRDDSEAPLTFEGMADDYAALLDQLHVSAAYVIGWSDGGIVALLLAQRHPEKVIKLAATGANIRVEAGAFAPGLWADWQKDYAARKDQPRTTAKEKNDWKLFLLDYREPNLADADLKVVTCPALIICGDHDVISIEHTVEIYRSLPHGALWVVPGSGHATLREHAGEFDRVVEGFFEK